MRPSSTAALLVGCGVVLSNVAFTTVAMAGSDRAQCMADADEGQRARSAGRLRAAAERFNACARANCPAIIQQDCSKWETEVRDAIPSIVIDARDEHGNDVAEANVSIDGARVARLLDGKAILVDPGKHTVVVERAGSKPVTTTLIAKEGVKARPVEVTLEPEGATKREPPPKTPPPAASERDAGGHGALPWIVTGVGLAAVATGVVLVVTAPERPANCRSEPQHECDQPIGVSNAAFADQLDTAARSDNQRLAGFVLAGAGGAVAIGGLVWHFLEPTPGRSASRRWHVVGLFERDTHGAAVVGVFE